MSSSQSTLTRSTSNSLVHATRLLIKLKYPYQPLCFYSGPKMIQLEPELDHTLLPLTAFQRFPLSMTSQVLSLTASLSPLLITFGPAHSTLATGFLAILQMCWVWACLQTGQSVSGEGQVWNDSLCGITVDLDTSGDVTCHPCTNIYLVNSTTTDQSWMSF